MKDNLHWTITAKSALALGQSVTATPVGESMAGLIANGDTVMIEPFGAEHPCVGDIVLVEIQARRFKHTVLHLIKEIRDGKILIGANNGRIDGWVSPDAVFGRVAREKC